jgi:isopentenyl diphosphate isomerase/L-lactate dehydrogenase-like FMN-dependent dehydrogenase
MSSTFPTLPDMVEAARSNLSTAVWNWIEGGASGEQSLDANRAQFDRVFFAPEMLNGAGPVDLSSDFFGLKTALPIFAAPFGSDGQIHSDRYLGVARALGATGNTGIVSETSTDSLEAIAEAFDGQQGMLQVGLHGPDEHVLTYAERAAAAGFRGLCFTGQSATKWRERIRRWGDDLDLKKHSGIGNQSTGMANPGQLLMDPNQPKWTWERLARISEQLPLPWVLKGVVTAEEARRALDAGASGIYVSTFGGRNVDGMIPTLEALPAVVAEVDGRVPVLVDSGFRRGTDVAKALALGATAVGFGRLTAFGLAADGESGVRQMVELLEGELISVLGSLGVSRPAELAARHVVRL